MSADPSPVRDVDVLLYGTDGHEFDVLTPVGAELERRGARVQSTRDFTRPATLGLYASHTNVFYDFDGGVWRRPPNACSVIALHDLGGAEPAAFADDSWHVFDLGLLPGPAWMQAWRTADAAGVPGPVLGVREGGWPKGDHAFAGPDAFAARQAALRADLGLDDERPVVLLACSWSSVRQLEGTVAALGTDAVQLVVKYPASLLPAAGSPWEARLTSAYHEMKRARALALDTHGVIVPDDDVDIMTLVSLADAIVSDGSNLLYEGVVAGVPGVCVRDWPQFAGARGEELVPPSMDLTGVVCGPLPVLAAMVRVVLDPAWAPLVTAGGDDLVGARGTAVERSVAAIEAALLATAGRTPGQLAALAAAARDPRRPDDPLRVADEQLAEYDTALRAARSALDDAAVREHAAREQLAAYEALLAVDPRVATALKRNRPLS